MKFSFSYLFTFILLVSVSIAQNRANIWQFRGGEGIDFNSNPPTLITTGSIATAEGTAAISDTTGNLLFYTEGVTVWDKNHNPMPNGTGLLGDISTTQSALIVPQPGSPNLYYLFANDQTCGPDGLTYSVVDMNLNAGLGDVIPGSKNTPLLSPTFEKIAAVHHCNGEDIWLMAIEANTGDFYTWLITEDGLCNCPTITQTGPRHEEGFAAMKFSNNGKRLVVLEAKGTCGANSIHTDLYDFDNNVGIPSFVQTIDTGVNSSSSGGGHYWGASFSPNNQVLYLSTGFYIYNGSGGITQHPAVVQYDLTAPVIENSAVVIFDNHVSGGGCGSPMGGLQLGPDGRIYVGNSCPTDLKGIDVIENPDVLGTGCNYTHGAIPGAVGAGYGMTYFIESYFGQGVAACDSLISNNMCNWITQQNCPLTDITESSGESSLSFFPNPMQEKMEISFPNPLKESLSIAVFSTEGKLVWQKKEVLTDQVILDRGSLAPGIYFVRVMNQTQPIASGKFWVK